ncbi:MAG: PKD domain-containing protein [Euryarchaeota archaeon]|nr:PKD domain-containing protein [Euryarchaeota archaeon]
MNKKKIAVILITLLLIPILAGCLGGNKQEDDNTSILNNVAPVPVITAPEKAYFGDPIIFDASKSYDPDGTVESYAWIFDDNETAGEVTATHTYELQNDFRTEYPIFYSVVLSVVDNNGSCEYTAHEIMLYPKEYTFYFDSGKLATEKPASNKDTIKASFGKFKFNPIKELNYELSDFAEILPCTWNATIYLEKPRFTVVNRVLLTLYNETGEKIADSDSSFGFFWKEKTIKIQGSIDTPGEFKSIKLVVYGFSLRNKISILYGDEKASQICFNFAI